MLEIKNIWFSVKQDGEIKDILKNISLSIKDNELIIITGHNGSGKSTLAKILIGILKPTKGQILYNGKDITNMSITQRANLGFSYSFQQPILFKGLTVKDLIDIASKKKNSIAGACDYLSKVGLCAKEYLQRQVDGKLSGGELKRIEIATVLARDSELNIFDEPEAGIDLWSFETLINLFKNKSKTNIVISHQQKIIDIADKVLLLQDGSIKGFGENKEIIELIEREYCDRLRGEIYE